MKPAAQILKELRYPSGLFSAAAIRVSTGYDKSWIRDNIYEAMGLEIADIHEAVRTYQALLDILRKHEYKIDYAIRERPQHRHQYIHARYHPATFEEFHEEWGNKQNDAVGAMLFKIADLAKKGIVVVRDADDMRIIQKLVYYLKSIEYWHDRDNGIWEENEEVHASSVGACVAGLRGIKEAFPDIDVPKELIVRGECTLNTLLPRESETKEADLALLSLVWPYRVTDNKQTELILKNIEERLLRTRGVIRYAGDVYYNEGSEAEWTMGLPWLAIIYRELGDMEKYKSYMIMTRHALNREGELPELYYGGTARHNENTPLGWSQALYLIAMSEEI